MIITERYPQNSLYVLGAELIKILENEKEYTIFDLYNSFNRHHKVSLKYFILTIDWLFLINVVNITENGFIKKCS
ncbi:ABC-three component system middle component 6 [Campylobacter pinnipediorum]|uniref:Uncharacterized protein n=1 Tax=Campylobacter pinnipediorum subsp. pinnipediorum TaxID=1660067 RepID=A0AAX0L9G3_9BACT|nr:ABC-three component system middle component 6 [Campylobacter pinnipediorum]AQW82888.1 hypothetical protein CPIN17261_0878 [Campylobacter pinnipediorum subsp. pinnipediorum]OPA77230.1 hypothetical protein BFG04_03805 [Campylobacter pinnipediorum subsp. pinnipediorum]